MYLLVGFEVCRVVGFLVVGVVGGLVTGCLSSVKFKMSLCDICTYMYSISNKLYVQDYNYISECKS